MTSLLPLLLALAPASGAASTAPVRGVHLTAWVAGSGKDRRLFLDKAAGTVVNAVIVPVKEYDGKVYIPGVASAAELGTVRIAIPDPRALVADIKARGMRAIARVVVFKDDTLARRRPEWAVTDVDGGVWKNKKGVAWVDPYRREVWDYNLDVALAAAQAGFDEVQFDYIRFPSDGDTRRCRYSHVSHSSATAVAALEEFMALARRRLDEAGVGMSAAVFGLTTTAHDDMGIGQALGRMARSVDALSPMMYPSHYARGEYGLSDPNREPYRIISWGLRDAKRKLGGTAKLRPYLQDFSLGHRYGVPEVRAELRAASHQGVESWILWNPQNRYTWAALSPLSAGEAGPKPGEDEPPARVQKPAARDNPRPAPETSTGTAPSPLPEPAVPPSEPVSVQPDQEEL
ncbi:MAG: hypothetical protein HY928_12640 [Elusimicrobia bacterium]|nr:hypothetical protein [Elusimicrobiota bacterium]